MMRVSVIAALLSLCALQAYGLEPDKMYKSGARVSHAGISFVVPTGWFGGVPSGSSVMVLGSKTQPGLVLVMIEPKITPDQLVEALSRPLPLDDATVLTPVGQAQRKGKTVTSRYQLQTPEGLMQGRATATFDGSGRAVGFLALGPQTHQKQRGALLKRAIASVKFIKRPKPGSGKGAAKLRGKKLMYMKTNHGFSEKKEIILCSSGVAYWASHSSSISQLGSGVSRSEDQGVWWVQGKKLMISWNKGGMREERLAKGTPKRAALKHWFFVAQDQCP